MTIRNTDRNLPGRLARPDSSYDVKPKKLKKGATAAPDPKERPATKSANPSPAEGARAASDSERVIAARTKKRLKGKAVKGSQIGIMGSAYGKRAQNYATGTSPDPLSPH